ncbi:hypothetical protein CEE37_12155 [candidate division LCP-89 bacterium B3_LCP]|uniref:Cyanobacterial TRADD-N associated 2 transmembrane domain-containing protein n=1 Tax=candidate division LCP-89 bacterium B3_LCP TaxID=2012998 RepID=A0A532UU94_UNCL8|nr:MAG: hypothetical protein CEE37_12155 [candidate division LCP-89 bacterium B3_LCP]
MVMEPFLLGAAASEMLKAFSKVVDKASKEKKTYADKLESATGNEIFKYILLINIAALEGYIAQTRIQAQQSFSLSRIMAIVGFFLLAIAIGISIFSTFSGNVNLNAVYLSSIAGMLTEFIAGVFFYLYNKALQQINLFHDKLVTMQQVSMSFLATSMVTDEAKRDQAKMELANKLIQQNK